MVKRKGRGGRPVKYDYMPRAGIVVIDPAKLRYWRDVRCMTRDDLAEASHIPVLSIGEYEKGRRCPKPDRFRRLFTALGVGPEDLLLEGGRYIPSDPQVDDTE